MKLEKKIQKQKTKTPPEKWRKKNKKNPPHTQRYIQIQKQHPPNKNNKKAKNKKKTKETTIKKQTK